MVYIVEVGPRYSEGRMEAEKIPELFYGAQFTDEGEARTALHRYLEDEMTLSKLSNRFRPEFVMCVIKYRGDYGNDWEIIYTESLVL